MISKEYKIVVQGTKKIISYLKDYLKMPNKIFYFPKQNKNYFNKIKTAEVVITMSWGKTMWGGKDNIKTETYLYKGKKVGERKV